MVFSASIYEFVQNTTGELFITQNLRSQKKGILKDILKYYVEKYTFCSASEFIAWSRAGFDMAGSL